MILDFNDSSVSTVFKTDVCIIGSGAAGLALLEKFYDSKLNVLVLEAGGEKITDQNQQIYDVISLNYPLNGARDGRFRVFGGTTTKWGGQSLPLDRIDFAHREWVPFSGWPIKYSEVYPYYTSVDNFLNIHETEYEADIYNLIRKTPLPPNEKALLKFSKWSPTPNLREMFRKKLSKSLNITILQNANLFKIDLVDDYTSVKKIYFKNFCEKHGQVKAKKYILACGGIENARILLASHHQVSTGIGNAEDVVGRFLQDHPKAFVGEFTDSSELIQCYFNYFYINRTRFLPRLFLSENFQREQRLLNVSATLKFQTADNHPFTIAKEIYRKQVRGQLSKQEFINMMKLVRHMPQMLLIGKKYFLENKVYTPNARVKLNLMVETTPSRENRVSLCREKDRLGMHKATIFWKIDDKVLRTFYQCSKYFKNYLDVSGLGSLKLADWVTSEDWQEEITDSNHHIGTTRMSNTKKLGVVDTNCKVFDIDNLYIAGSSIFPTSGHSNPTSTIIALAFRLAEHIISDSSNLSK